MKRVVMTIAASAFLALVSTAFLSAVGGPVALVSLPLLLVIALVMNFRERDAYVAAMTAGIITDILAAAPAGVHVATWLLLTLLVSTLFTRVFTHLSLTAFAGMNTAAFLLLLALNTSAAALQAAFGGLPRMPAPSADATILVALGLAAHVVVAFVLLMLSRGARLLAAPFILVKRA